MDAENFETASFAPEECHLSFLKYNQQCCCWFSFISLIFVQSVRSVIVNWLFLLRRIVIPRRAKALVRALLHCYIIIIIATNGNQVAVAIKILASHLRGAHHSGECFHCRRRFARVYSIRIHGVFGLCGIRV